MIKIFLIFLTIFSIFYENSVALADDIEGLNIVAAGSLKGALDEIAANFTRQTKIVTHITYGPAGELSRNLASGTKGDIFLSANMAYPQYLKTIGLAEKPLVFVKNRLCISALKSSGLTPETLLTFLLKPTTVIGISTPGNDPGGDYAWQVLSNLEHSQALPAGSVLYRAKALVGGTVLTPPVPQGENPVSYFLRSGTASVFMAYCSRHSVMPANDMIQIPVPDNLTMAVDYGAVILKRTKYPDVSKKFIDNLTSEKAKEIFRKYGFSSL